MTPGSDASGSHGPSPQQRARWALLSALALAALHPLVSPALALGVGVVLGLAGLNPAPKRVSKAASWLLKACVVGLGFGLSLGVVLRAGATGVGVTAVSITLTLALGLLAGRLLRVETDASALVSGGTAICGGSAIAALGPAIGASGEAMGVSLACVFLLNGVALYVFPPVGHLLELSQSQFAMWAALAIHDTSSVVGASAVYGKEALEQATILKLTRALWIVPLVLAAAAWHRRRLAAQAARDASGAALVTDAPAAKPALPWFIAFFVLASAARAALPAGAGVFDVLNEAARRGLVVSLLLIGAGLTRATLAKVGVRPLVQAVAVWVVVACATLAWVLAEVA